MNRGRVKQLPVAANKQELSHMTSSPLWRPRGKIQARHSHKEEINRQKGGDRKTRNKRETGGSWASRGMNIQIQPIWNGPLQMLGRHPGKKQIYLKLALLTQLQFSNLFHPGPHPNSEPLSSFSVLFSIKCNCMHTAQAAASQPHCLFSYKNVVCCIYSIQGLIM